VATADLRAAAATLARHDGSKRPCERDHPLATRCVSAAAAPEPNFRAIAQDRRDLSRLTRASPMAAVDDGFLAAVRANPRLRPRIGNPDEMRSNRMQRTLDALRFRVTQPEAGIPESLDGAVITALDHRAVPDGVVA
jgi:phosphoketolase